MTFDDTTVAPKPDPHLKLRNVATGTTRRMREKLQTDESLLLVGEVEGLGAQRRPLIAFKSSREDGGKQKRRSEPLLTAKGDTQKEPQTMESRDRLIHKYDTSSANLTTFLSSFQGASRWHLR